MKVKTYIQRNGKDLVVKLTKGKGRLIYQHLCRQCSTEFISNRSTAIYCSDGCRKKQFDEVKRKRSKEVAVIRVKKFMREARFRLKNPTL